MKRRSRNSGGVLTSSLDGNISDSIMSKDVSDCDNMIADSSARCFDIFGGDDGDNAMADVVNSSASVKHESNDVDSANFFLNQTQYDGNDWGRRKNNSQKKWKRKSSIPDDVDNNSSSDHPDLSSLIASELTKLSLEDRVKALEEVHGVVETIKEDPEEIKRLMEQVKEELKRLRYKQAYEKAAFLSSTYVNNPEFVLHFLRADNNNPRHAAIRLAEHFKFKLELFGEHTLVRDILYEDLTADEQLILNSGFIQKLPALDTAGRQIVVCNMSEFLKIGNLRNVCRAMWYLTVRTSQMNPSVNSMGVVGVYFAHEIGNVFEKLSANKRTDFANGTGFMQNALPYKLASVHFCFDNKNHFGSAIQKYIMMALGRYARVRLRSHCGSRIECEYALKSFGIDIDTYKTNPLASVHEWLQHCKSLDESHRKELETKILPRPNDVLLGRGRPFQLYSGNLALTTKIDENKPRYATAKKMYKKTITIEIVESIHNGGGRFLKKVSNDESCNMDWEEVDFETARLKVSHSFRTMSKGNSSNEEVWNNVGKGSEEILVEPILSMSAEDADVLGFMAASIPSDVDPMISQINFSSSNKRRKW
mmetsp:Transcript_9341/g.23245  ORF Transcript_9341/g.23245 Transcript_9341/m.23245 type:complete len:592 (+) Transcript_9341:191-1966(+)